jgi:hypothetical protein
MDILMQRMEMLNGKPAQGQKPAARPANDAGEPPIPGARKAPDGNYYIEDPDRQGKFLRIAA